MKTLLVGINSKYIHSNLAIRYIKKYVEKNSEYKIKIREWTINNHIEKIIKDIYNEKPEILAFSVYIWNSEYVFKIIKEIKKILPEIKLILGGPEVSYNSIELMKKIKEIDYIIKGEGERTFLNLLSKNMNGLKGLYYREENEVKYNGDNSFIINLDEVPFVYDDEEIENLKNRIIYYESSRGCPFNCSYCMSSIEKRVRFFSNERTKKDLKFFLDKKVKLIKFVDRTYNIDKKRYLDIWKFLLENYSKESKFHFEISVDLFDDEILDFLKKVPEDYFQFEIGIQTSNEKTLKAINRSTNMEKLEKNIKRLIENGNIHIHLDLIAGLPYEDYESIGKSFNYIYNFKSEMFQLGFLKILEGTQISTEIEEFEYKYLSSPPYEVLENKFMSYKELQKIKDIEHLLDIYYNSGDFKKSVDYIIINCYDNSFAFYEEISEYWVKKGYFEVKHKKNQYFNYLYEFIGSKNINLEKFEEILKFDYLCLGKPGVFPEWYKRNQDKERYDEVLKNEVFKNQREAHKKSEFEKFSYDVINEKIKNVEILFLYDKGLKIKVIK